LALCIHIHIHLMDMDICGYIHNRRWFFHSEEAQTPSYISFNLTKPLYIFVKTIFVSSLGLELSFDGFLKFYKLIVQSYKFLYFYIKN
jgi:hypothetical protein